MKTSGQEAPKGDESHIYCFKRPAMKAIKQAKHRKKNDIHDIRVPVEEKFTMGHKYAISLPVAVLRLLSDTIHVFLRQRDRETQQASVGHAIILKARSIGKGESLSTIYRFLVFISDFEQHFQGLRSAPCAVSRCPQA
jgi:hypothetical protein